MLNLATAVSKRHRYRTVFCVRIILDQHVIKDGSDRSRTEGTLTHILLQYCKSQLRGVTKTMEDNH